MKTKLALVALCICTKAIAIDQSPIMDKIANELSTCTALFILASQIGHDEQEKESMLHLANVSQNAAIIIAGQDTAKTKLETVTKKVVKELQRGPDSLGNMLNKYGENCLSMMRDPDRRMQYLIDKEKDK